jgi:hypothetical protein
MAVFGVGKVLLKPQAQVQSWSSVRDGRGREVIREIPIKTARGHQHLALADVQRARDYVLGQMKNA